MILLCKSLKSDHRIEVKLNNNNGEQFMSFKEDLVEFFAGTKFSENFRHR